MNPLANMELIPPNIRSVSITGSYGWGGRTVDILKNPLSPLRIEYLPSVLIKGHPRREDLKTLENLAEEIKQHMSM
ncbi:hypothetical protein DRQ20_05570 [bacterium]|nr:MAG: hypothetical protein DRQ20_05570 [bacterium]